MFRRKCSDNFLCVPRWVCGNFHDFDLQPKTETFLKSRKKEHVSYLITPFTSVNPSVKNACTWQRCFAASKKPLLLKD